MKDLLEELGVTEKTIEYGVRHMNLCDRIYEAIQNKKWTQKEFAKEMQVDEALVSRWLAGVHYFGEETLYKMEDVLGITLIVRDGQKVISKNEYTRLQYHQKRIVSVHKKRSKKKIDGKRNYSTIKWTA